jgi:diguanylate cyclase (GGDEF)-like protein
MSEHDHLTGLYNRRYAEAVVAQMLPEAERQGVALSVGLADLDHFKRINDTWSHQAGDAVLQRFSDLLAAATPPDGLAVRLGGEEFLLVLNHHDPDAARQVCEELRRQVSELDWSDLVGELPVTVSIGVATVTGRTVTWSELLAEADRHLYQAKRSGRDRVVDSAAALTV